ncbi:MAG: signal peptidase II [Anaerovoracaceae bacterium]|jgi:signal peptidase II
MYLILAVIIVIVDQLVKFIVSSGMDLNQTIPIVDNVFHLTYIHNSGAAFNLFEGKTELLIALPLVIIAFILVYVVVKREKEHWLQLLSLALIAGGGMGNLIDRIVHGVVIDYFDFRVFPIFNVADIAVTVGCGLMIIYLMFVDLRVKETRPDEGNNKSDN